MNDFLAPHFKKNAKNSRALEHRKLDGRLIDRTDYRMIPITKVGNAIITIEGNRDAGELNKILISNCHGTPFFI